MQRSEVPIWKAKGWGEFQNYNTPKSWAVLMYPPHWRELIEPGFKSDMVEKITEGDRMETK